MGNAIRGYEGFLGPSKKAAPPVLPEERLFSWSSVTGQVGAAARGCCPAAARPTSRLVTGPWHSATLRPWALLAACAGELAWAASASSHAGCARKAATPAARTQSPTRTPTSGRLQVGTGGGAGE